MKIKGLIDEDFINYKYPSMFISTYTCNFKCDKECGQAVCQNLPLVKAPTLEIDNGLIVSRYINNNITKSIVIGGLEPMDDFNDVLSFCKDTRRQTSDDIVIYTGYYEYEIQPYIDKIKASLTNIVVKFGRFIPNQQPHYDDTLGVSLASDNQYGVRIC